MTHAQAKPNLVLLHGWGLGNCAWDAALPALAERFQVHRLACPGYGVNKRSTEVNGQEAHEQTALEPILCRTPFGAVCRDSFLETAKALVQTLPADAIVCGWSLGGMLALQMTALAPQRIKRLVLVGSTPSFTQRVDWPHAQPPALLDTFHDSVDKDAASTLQRFVALLNQGDAQARSIGRTLNKSLQSTALPDTATLLAGLGWLRDVDLREQIAAIAMPMLLIHGENDPLMPLAAAHWLHENLPDARLEVITGAAHAPFLNNPERFATLIGEYCNAPALD